MDINRQDHIVFWDEFTVATSCTTNIVVRKLFRSTDHGTSWQTSTGYGGDINKLFVLSPYNSNIIYTEQKESTYVRQVHKIGADADLNYSPLTPDMILSTNHTDVRALIIAPESPNIAASNPTGSSDILYVGNDGGVSKTENGLNWTIKNGYGLAIAQYYGLGITEQDKDFMYAGAQDGSIGNFYHGKYFNEDPGYDNGDCIIDATNDPANVVKIVYQESWTDPGGTSLPTYKTKYNINTNHLETLIDKTPYGSDDIDDIAVTLEQNPFQPNQIAGGYQQVYLTQNKGDSWGHYTNTAIHPNRVPISSICFSGINSFYYAIAGIGGSGGIYSVPDKNITSGIVEISNNLKTGSLSIGRLAPITDITVDPSNTQRIWITFGGFIANSKVYHSENGGLSWTNISGNGCLPNIPFSSICYQEGSNDRIYVGTDIGVFFRDNSMTDGRWDFYGIGGPRNLISDMDINDCGQKLVCSTLGRGLWEVPLIPNPELVISVNNTWSISGIKNMYRDIHITRGAGGASTTLKILAGTLNMAEGKKIIIDKGCKLLVKDATITNGCNTMWEGIKVDGAGSGQDLSGPDNLTNISCNQGYIYLENATISNAHNAISTINSPTTTICSGLYDASGMFGGIVRAVNTTFRNNGRSAEFLMLRSFPPPPMLEPNNLSYFQSCTFTIDDNYPSENPFYAHVTMWNTYGISFTSCSFNNLKTSVAAAGGLSAAESLGKGIYSIDAHYSVTLSAFESLTNGISVDNSSSGTVNIFKNGFIDNLYGLRLNTSNNSIIRNNTFAVGTIDVPSSYHPLPIGSSFISSSKYTMNNNIYNGTTDVSIGSWFIDNGGDDNLCITNKFQSLKFANISNKKNRFSDGSKGLVFRCNQNIQNYKDFTSYSNYSYPSDGYVIRDNQGLPAQPVGNTFSTPPSIATEAHFQQSDWNNVNYFVPPGSSIYRPILAKCTPPPHFNIVAATSSVNCPFPVIDPWTGGGGAHKKEMEVYAGEDIQKMSSSTRDSIEADFLMHQNDYKYYSLQLKNLIDGGNTERIKEDIQNSNETAELRAKLLNQSPYMSTDALKEAIDKTGVLPDAILFEILGANSDAIRDAVLLDYLEKKPEPLPSWMLEYLKENMATVTARTLLDYAVSEAHEKMMLSARAILHDIQFNPEGLDHVALRYWLGQLMDKEADYMIADDYIEAGNFENAKTIIEAIPVLYKLNESERLEHASSLDLMNWKIAVLRDGSKSIARLNEAEKDDLAKIAETGKGVAKYKAENILNYFYDGKYIHLPELPEETSGKRDLTANTIEKDIPSYLKVYPNPAKDLTTFEYQLPCISHEGILTVTDITGKIIYMNNKLTGEHNILNLDTKEWQSGNYLYKLVCDGVNIGEGKLSIIK